MTSTVFLIVGFTFVILASHHIGRFATFFKLPLITGYLLAGAMVGPFFLGWISRDGAQTLRLVDHTALAFIAFAAGNELYLKEVRSRIRSIAWTTGALVLSTFTLGSVAVLLIADHVSFMRGMPFSARLAVAMMAGAILVARSPSSAIAIINEMRARGPYTKTALGVTVVMDAVVILLFSTASTISQSLVASVPFDPLFILRVLLDLLMSLLIGYVTGRLLQVVISSQANIRIKAALMLGIGLGAFWFAHAVKDYSHIGLSWPVSPEPLLACMIAGFVVTNYSRHRDGFSDALHEIGPTVYLVFFTLVGASLALDALVSLWHIGLILFGVRLMGIIIGSVSGGLISGAAPRHVRLGWMAYVTQAGVGLGLAKDVAAEFPVFGQEFATMIIAIIVLNQIVGPPLFKFAIKRVGESHRRAEARPDEIRDALILGICDQSLALARQLVSNGWEVIIADTDASHVDHVAKVDIETRLLPRIDEEQLSRHLSSSTNALVTMLNDDDENYSACEIGYEKFGIPRLIVRLNDLSNSDRFGALGALVVEPASAMVNLLDQFVRLPRLATMLLHRDPHHEVIQITVADPDIDGLPLHELRLPHDVRVLGISRGGDSIVPQGNTVIQRNDEVTLVGEPKHLEQLATRWGY